MQKPETCFTLLKYSALAGSLLAISTNSKSQIIYHDIDPDIELEDDGYFA